MADEIQITSIEELQQWLSERPPECSREIAFHAAARALSEIRPIDHIDDWSDVVAPFVLTAFRCLLIAANAFSDDAPEEIRRSAGYAAMRADMDSFKLKGHSESSGYAIEAAAYAARAASWDTSRAVTLPEGFAEYAAIAFTAAARAAEGGKDREVVFMEADWFENLEMDRVSLRFQSRPLKREKSGTLDYSLSRLIENEDLTGRGFKPWFSWYAAVTGGDSGKPIASPFGSDLEYRIATQPKDWWDRGSDAVNADIAAWLIGQERDAVLAQIDSLQAQLRKLMPPDEVEPVHGGIGHNNPPPDEMNRPGIAGGQPV